MYEYFVRILSIFCADILNAENPDHIDINTLMQYGYMELRLIIEWARKVPGHATLVLCIIVLYCLSMSVTFRW